MRLLRALAWIVVAVWSLVAFSAYGLLDLVGGLVARHADAFSPDPNVVEWTFRILNGLKDAGLTAILIVWGLVSLAILAGPWTVGRLTRPRVRVYRPEMQTIYPPPGSGRPIVEVPRPEPPRRLERE